MSRPKPTYEAKLTQMRADLAHIVATMNKDRSYEIAQKAQHALVLVADLHDDMGGILELECLLWDWKPSGA